MNTQTHGCIENEGSESEACTQVSRAVLLHAGGWLMVMALTAVAFIALTHARTVMPRAYVAVAIAVGVALVLAAAAGLGLTLHTWWTRRATSHQSDAGDSHACFVDTQPAAARLAAASQHPPRRVRAGHPPPMRYSYDGRKKTPTA